jgi:CRP-like cAMP-binding protein
MELNYILATSPAFAGLTPSDRDILERAMTVERYPDGHLFIREGARPRETHGALHILLRGRILVTAAGRDEDDYGVVRLLDPGEVFGIVALVSDGPRTATCRAAGPVKVATMGREAFHLLWTSNLTVATRFQLALARQLAHDLRNSNQQVRQAFADGEVAEVRGKVVRV